MIGRVLDRVVVRCRGFSLVHVMSYGRDIFTWVAVRLHSSFVEQVVGPGGWGVRHAFIGIFFMRHRAALS